MTEKNMDPKLKKILQDFAHDMAVLVDASIHIGEMQGLDLCKVFDGVAHVIAHRLGQLEIIHIESDLAEKNKSAKIDKDLLTKTIGSTQLNTIYSLMSGMNDALKSGGHYTLDELKKEMKEDLKSSGKKNSDDDDGGKTFH